ncbi:MAG: sterol desaturase family protein [Daejeonella sp.]
MQYLINISLLLFTLIGMEVFSWSVHRYLFHGPLWFIHKSHHQKHRYWFEFNDVFSLIFCGISLLLMWYGRLNFNAGFWIGAGTSVYGIIYFIFHDWFIHNRFKAFKTTNTYLLRLRKAHKIHHKSTNKLPAEEFGLLIISKKYFRK